MPTTNTERIIKQRRESQGVLRPLLENFMQKPVNIESQADVEFLEALLQKMLEREDRRRDPNSNVYSPSALASCLRHVYLKRHHRALKIKPRYPAKVEPNFYFLTGNFLHIKWQFALWKMILKIDDPAVVRMALLDGDTEPYGFEVAMMSKHGDHAGTADAIPIVYDELCAVDFKGLNVRTFGEITRGFIPPEYRLQLNDYMILWNAQPKHMVEENFIKKGLLMVENKGGPDPKHPLALHEVEIPYKPAEVQARLKTLREHERKEKVPKPECTSVNSYQFQGCPFAGFCRDEVKRIQRKSRKNDEPTEYRISKPSRKRK